MLGVGPLTCAMPRGQLSIFVCYFGCGTFKKAKKQMCVRNNTIFNILRKELEKGKSVLRCLEHEIIFLKYMNVAIL